MIYTKNSPVVIYLGNKAHSYAQKCVSKYAILQNYKWIYLTSLAMYAVHRALKRSQIETDLEPRDTLNMAIPSLFDVGNLILPGIGQLECCPVLPGETTIDLTVKPAQDNLIGYVAVQFQNDFQKVELLGFIPAVHGEYYPKTIHLAELKTYEALLDYITEKEATTFNQPQTFSQRIQKLFHSSWQPVEISYDAIAASAGCCEEVSLKRGKIVDLGGEVGQVLLIVSPTKSEECEEELEITVEVISVESKGELPPQLCLEFMAESGEVIDKIKLRTSNRRCQLDPIIVSFEESFSIRLSLGETEFKEDFSLK